MVQARNTGNFDVILAVLVEKHVIALMSAERCTQLDLLPESGVLLRQESRFLFPIRAYNCTPEVRSYIYG